MPVHEVPALSPNAGITFGPVLGSRRAMLGQVGELGEAAGGRQVILRTSRLLLTTWLSQDVDDLLDLHSDPEGMRYVRSGRPETRAETVALIDQYMAEQTARGWTKWRLADQADTLLGRAGFGGDDQTRGISFHIHRNHWRRGIASEIAAALVEWHLAHAPTVALRGLVAHGNEASRRVLHKVGFLDTGTEDYDGIACYALAYPIAT